MECISGIISGLMAIGALFKTVGNLFDEDKPASSRLISLIVLLMVAIIVVIGFITLFRYP
jgi:hypothetical protein